MKIKFDKLVMTVLLATICGVALADPENRLIGKWQSDKKTTIMYSKKVYPDIPKKTLDHFNKVLGNLTVIITEKEVISEINGMQIGKDKYKNLLVTESLTVIEDEDDGPIVWYRDGDLYYLVTENPYMPREYFKKVE